METLPSQKVEQRTQACVAGAPSRRVAWVAVEPTPYLMPLFRRVKESGCAQVEYFFCAERSTQPWSLDAFGELAAPESFARGWRWGGRYFNPAIVRAVLAKRWDAVVLSGYSHWTMQALIASCMWRRIPVLIHSDTHGRRRRGWWKQACKRLVLFPVLRRSAAALVTGELAREYWENLGLPADRVFLVPYPSHLDAFRLTAEPANAARQETRRRLGVAATEVVGICVGRLVWEKGFDVALEALSRLGPGERPTLLFVGDGGQRERLAGETAARKLPVRFLGFCDHRALAGLYAAADFFLLPSREEPWGVVVAEAMSAGLPVVLSDQVGAAYDLLEEGRNGFLVPTGSASALAEVLRRCVDQSERLAEMGNQSRAMIARWTCQAAADEVVRALDGLGRRSVGVMV